MADEVKDLESYRSIARAVERGDDVSAKHVAAALVEHGTHRVFELIAALELSTRPSGAEGGAGDDERA
jgi:hypothetical protein